MRVRRFLRTALTALTFAALTALSLASTVMAVTGGGDFPVRR